MVCTLYYFYRIKLIDLEKAKESTIQEEVNNNYLMEMYSQLSDKEKFEKFEEVLKSKKILVDFYKHISDMMKISDEMDRDNFILNYVKKLSENGLLPIRN